MNSKIRFYMFFGWLKIKILRHYDRLDR